jgi:integrase
MATVPTYLTQDELKRFFAAIESLRDKALFGLIYHDGLRVGEALMLTVDDVNFKNHRITVRRLKHGLGGEKPQWIGDQAPFVRPDNSQRLMLDSRVIDVRMV